MAYSQEFMTSLFRMAGALVLVLGMALVGIYLLRRFKIGGGGAGGADLLQVVASRYVGTRQWIVLVEAAGVPLVVGVSRDRLQLLATLAPGAIAQWRGRKNPERRPGFREELEGVLEKGDADGSGRDA